ncbi:MAG: hypothetical protein GC168_15320 [Candidatus Hydrogenedens sp.]|nr:hypothetical protein [Candidatus Hydrogenedens sp.]
MRFARRLMTAAALLALQGCGGSTVPPAPAPASTPVAETPTPPPAPPTQPKAQPVLIARIEVVDLEGNPLPGMLPIVTTQSNAFDEPLSVGAPTDAAGHGSVSAPNDAHLYLRAWDPEMAYFATNFYDLLPGEGGQTDVLRVQMVRGVPLEATLNGPDGAPIAGESAGVLLIHPTAGPWWPARGATDALGRLRLDSVPPGRYTLRIKTEDGRRLEVPDVDLAPGSAPDLGALTLQ